ncbi:hypothetical protein Mapa_012100 [Marchantia paleacea]|nr:hypothetical protein Mapa_012100 [Marchantia paleacea]
MCAECSKGRQTQECRNCDRRSRSHVAEGGQMYFVRECADKCTLKDGSWRVSVGIEYVECCVLK